MSIHKYPRTPHLQGSRLQPGDDDLDAVPFTAVRGKRLVVEEKIDGANAAVSFEDGQLRLQSRGHYLRGGEREKHFALLKTWASAHQQRLLAVLGNRYVMYGEWLYAKHTLFYDQLPHYFLEFDVLDQERDVFLSTSVRRELLQGLPVSSVPVLAEGQFTSLKELTALVKPALYKSQAWQETLRAVAIENGLEPERILAETDPSSLAEGLYLKLEENGQVTMRLKYVRHTFLTSVLHSGSHWLKRPVVPNQLAAGVDLFAG